jgi:glutathione peroxidase
MTVLSRTMTMLNGEPKDLSEYQGSVVLIVNTASNCGFTYQYEGLESLYAEYKDRGLVILGFPCNQFGKQEPGSAADIGAFCQKNYGVTFPMFSKIDVNGDDSAPLYEDLKAAAPGLMGTKAIKWNFTKFLVNRDGQVIERYAPTSKPESLKADIEKALA